MSKDVYTYHLESIFNALNILSFLGCEIKMASRSLQMRRNIALFPRQQHLQTTASSLGQTQNNFGPRLSDEIQDGVLDGCLGAGKAFSLFSMFSTH